MSFKISQQFSRNGDETDVGDSDDIVTVTETLTFDMVAAQAVLQKLTDGEFANTSERATWETMKEYAIQVEREEAVTGGY